MQHPLLSRARVQSLPREYLATCGSVFAVFDARTQDSGNVSYGVEVECTRFFVKTAGSSADCTPHLSHTERIAALRNAARISASVYHRSLPGLRNVIETEAGPKLVYDWVVGDLVRNALARVRGLPSTLIQSLVAEICDLHVSLVDGGWIACDFYDGAMIYNFDRNVAYAIDLDSYHHGAFTNTVGRMFESTRFMAPETFEFGAPIDERTTVFTLGRTAAVLLSDGSLGRDSFRGSKGQYEAMLHTCETHPDNRFQTVDELFSAWTSAM